MNVLMGFNAIESALASGRRGIHRIWVQRGRTGGRLARLKALASRIGVPVEEVDRARIERLAGGRPRGAHQGVLAEASPLPYAPVETILGGCGPSSRLLVVDGVEDPRNLGAIIRTAAAAGVAGVILPQRRCVGLTPTVAKASAGTVERVPVARVGNLASFVKQLKRMDFWTVALDAASPVPWDRTTYPDRLALVVGGEGRGTRRLVREMCDQVVSVPMEEGVESLNVSVAAGICLYEALRQVRARRGVRDRFT